jgi:photosystem II stability/assembly factor-like uncharacterized protein
MKKNILLTAVLLCAILFSYGQNISSATSGKPFRITIPDNIKNRKAYQRAEWFYTQRAFPYDTFPAAMFIKEKDREIHSVLSRKMKNSDSATWKPLGPKGVNTTEVNWGTVSGRVKAIAVHPNDPLTVYIGAASGGLWKTTDGGENWLDIGHSLPSQSFGAIAIDPNNPDIIYAGSGEAILGAFYCYPGNGLYKSTDGGQTWSVITDGFGPVTCFSDLEVSPFNSNVVIAALGGTATFSGPILPNEGIWKSLDGGITWNRKLDVPFASDIAFHPTDPNKVYAAAGGYIDTPYGFFVSTDQGATWNQSNSGLMLQPSPKRMHFDISKSNPNIIYSVISDYNFEISKYVTKAFKSVDGGNSWINISVGIPLGGFTGVSWYDQGYYDLCIAVDPVNSNHVLIGNVELHRTTNGSTYAPVRPFGNNVGGTLVHWDYHKLVFAPSNPDYLYIGCDGGIYKSIDKGYTASSKNRGLETLQFYRIASHPNNPAIVMGGMQDNNSAITHNYGTDWNKIYYGDGMECFFDYLNPNVIYSSLQRGILSKSYNGGASFTDIWDFKGAWITPFLMHPNISNTIYAANQNFYKSKNGGYEFQVQALGISPVNITTMAQSHVTPSHMIFGTGIDILENDTGILVKISTDEGKNWTDVTANIPGEPRWISRVATDPVDENTMYVLRTGFSPGNKVWKTTDLGQTWTNISGNLPDLPCNDLFIYPENPKNLFVANDIGVYYSADTGLTWNFASEGMPFVPAMDFDYVIIDSNRYLRVGTHGRSIYETKLPASLGIPETVALAASSTFGLVRTFPNPINSITTIEYDLLKPGRVKLEVFNHLGQQLDELVNMQQTKGTQRVNWNTEDMPAGIYYYSLQAGIEVVSGKIIKIK